MNLTMRGLCPGDTKLMEGFFDINYSIQGTLSNKSNFSQRKKLKNFEKSWEQIPHEIFFSETLFFSEIRITFFLNKVHQKIKLEVQ